MWMLSLVICVGMIHTIKVQHPICHKQIMPFVIETSECGLPVRTLLSSADGGVDSTVETTPDSGVIAKKTTSIMCQS